jgi:hypothetical protein
MAGRPKFKIDYDLVKKLASIHCTQEEIASILGCSVDTLQRDEEFCGIYKREIDNAKASLRRLQFKSAEQGNPTVLIWLGKQLLGQRDKQEIASVNTNIDIDLSNLPHEALEEIAKAQGQEEVMRIVGKYRK